MFEAKNSAAPMVSIGTPVYNGAKYLRKALDSLLEQTFTDFELIISDNASTDDTQAICEEYARRDSRIRYVRQSMNIGAAENFRFVQQQAKGEFFMWAAHDDLWDRRHIELLLEKHKSGHFQLVASRPEFMELVSGKKFNFREIESGIFSEDTQKNYENFLRLHHYDYAKATLIYGLFRRLGMPLFPQLSAEHENDFAAVGFDVLFLCSVIISKPVAYVEQTTWIRGERFYREPKFNPNNSRFFYVKKIFYRTINTRRSHAIKTLISEIQDIYSSRFPLNSEFNKILSAYENQVVDLLLIDKSIVVKKMEKSFTGRSLVRLYRKIFSSDNPYIKSSG